MWGDSRVLHLDLTLGQAQCLALNVVHSICSPSEEVSVPACTLQQITLDKQLPRVLAQLDKVHLDVPCMVRQNDLQKNLGSTKVIRIKKTQMLASMLLLGACLLRRNQAFDLLTLYLASNDGMFSTSKMTCDTGFRRASSDGCTLMSPKTSRRCRRSLSWPVLAKYSPSSTLTISTPSMCSAIPG